MTSGFQLGAGGQHNVHVVIHEWGRFPSLGSPPNFPLSGRRFGLKGSNAEIKCLGRFRRGSAPEDSQSYSVKVKDIIRIKVNGSVCFQHNDDPRWSVIFANLNRPRNRARISYPVQHNRGSSFPYRAKETARCVVP